MNIYVEMKVSEFGELAKDLTLEDLEKMKWMFLDLQSETTREKSQLDETINRAKNKYIETGVPAETDWFNRATHKSKWFGRDLANIQNKLGIIGNMIKKINHEENERRFITIARELLTADQYQAIVDRMEING